MGRLTLTPFFPAVAHRHPAADLIHHTDRGALYSSGNYRRLMAKHGLLPSMSRHGDCYDNACAESFFSTLKNELVHGQTFATREAARMAIVSYIEGFYNRKTDPPIAGLSSTGGCR